MFLPSLILPFILIFSCKSDRSEFWTTGDSLRDYLLEEIFLETLLNPTMAVQDDRAILNNIFDPVLIYPEEVIFDLYTRSNPGEPFSLKVGDSENLMNSPFDGKRLTKMIVHGWIDTGNTAWLRDLQRNYLAVGDFNVICVNWSSGSAKEYLVAARLTRQVGVHLATFLEFLESKGNVSLDDVHVLGHSLGAHVAGFAGLEMSGRIGRITGMDPARPTFESPRLKDPKDRLDSTDAKFVDVIHTCAGTLGFVRPIGHIDFYPNGGGFRQPGCPVLSTQACSHSRSHQFVGESILYPEAFVAVQCDSWMHFKSGKCRGNVTAFMGEDTDPDARGTFFLETNSQSPFGKGEM